MLALIKEPTAWPIAASNGAVSTRIWSTDSDDGANPTRPPFVPVTGLPSSRNSPEPLPKPAVS
jgi:hypothetical protein